MQISVSETNDLVTVASPLYQIEFDRRYTEKQYPFLCIMDKFIINDRLMDEIDSYGIVKVDKELSSTSYFLNDSTLLLVPQVGFSTERLIELFSNFLQKLKD